MKKTQKALEEAAKKKSDENASAVNQCGEKILEIDKKIAEETNKVDAANSVIEEGQTVLQNSLAGKKVKKENVVKANALIKLGMENSKISNTKLAELTQEKKKLLEEMKKKSKKHL